MKDMYMVYNSFAYLRAYVLDDLFLDMVLTRYPPINMGLLN